MKFLIRIYNAYSKIVIREVPLDSRVDQQGMVENNIFPPKSTKFPFVSQNSIRYL